MQLENDTYIEDHHTARVSGQFIGNFVHPDLCKKGFVNSIYSFPGLVSGWLIDKLLADGSKRWD